MIRINSVGDQFQGADTCDFPDVGQFPIHFPVETRKCIGNWCHF